MPSCLTVTRGQLHAQTMTRASFLQYKSSTKFPLIVPKRERSPFSELKDRCFTSLQNIVYDFIQNLKTNKCTIRHLKRNFSRLCKLRKRSSQVCDGSHASTSFRRVIRRARAIARLSLTSLQYHWKLYVWHVLANWVIPHFIAWLFRVIYLSSFYALTSV